MFVVGKRPHQIQGLVVIAMACWGSRLARIRTRLGFPIADLLLRQRRRRLSDIPVPAVRGQCFRKKESFEADEDLVLVCGDGGGGGAGEGAGGGEAGEGGRVGHYFREASIEAGFEVRADGREASL